MEILEYNEEGYKKVLDYESWRVAFLNYADRFDNIKYLERHMLTDEVFVLLEGEATLILGLDMQRVKLEKNKVYNVQKAEWHAIRVSKDAKVFIVENSNTAVENTEYHYL